jgi:anti-sigma factor RsiW
MSLDANPPPHDLNADLCAYLDGESGLNERARAESALGRDPALARRLAMWRRNDSTLRAAFRHSRTRPSPDGAIPPIGPLESKESTLAPPGTIRSAAAAYLAGVLSAGAALVILRLAGAL